MSKQAGKINRQHVHRIQSQHQRDHAKYSGGEHSRMREFRVQAEDAND